MKLTNDKYEFGFVWMSSTEPDIELSPVFTTQHDAEEWHKRIEDIVVKEVAERLK